MQSNNKPLLSFGILSLSLLTIMAGAAVSPALADIQNSIKGAQPTLIKMILTLPAVFIIPTSYCIGKFSGGISKKNLALAGVAIYTVSGCWAFFATDIYMLLASRAVLGVAVGIIMPVAAALIADFFHGEKRMRMMGYNAAFANFGGILATFSSGLLASINWRYAFLVYAMGIPVFIIAMLFIKEPEQTKNFDKKAPRLKLPLEVYIKALPGFLVFLGFYTIPTNIAVYLASAGLGGPKEAGYAMAFSTGTAMLLGLTVAKVRKKLGRVYVPSIAFSMLICHLLLGFTSSVAAVNLAMIANGYTLSMSIPYIMVKATEAAKGNNVAATSAVTLSIFIGQFFSPIVMDTIAKAADVHRVNFNFQLVAAATAFIFIITVFRSFRHSEP
ncbi:MFS transporter [Deferribacteres bacterium DY0037]|nr:MFS transporter [Denitrovibrio acetiphilus]